jgi:hypothetical protein
VPSSRRAEVAGRGDLQVVRARHQQVDLGPAGEARHHADTVANCIGLSVSPHRVGSRTGRPAGRLPRRCTASLRLDAQLAAQRDGVHRHAVVSAIRTVNASVGVTAYGSERADTQSKTKVAITPLRTVGCGRAVGEERGHALTHLRAAVEAAPTQPYLATRA